MPKKLRQTLQGTLCLTNRKEKIHLQNWDLFGLCPHYVMLPSITKHVSLHGKSLCKTMAHASGAYAPTKLGGGGGQNGKDPKIKIKRSSEEVKKSTGIYNKQK